MPTTPPLLRVSQRREGPVLVVRLAGELDLATADDLAGRLRELTAGTASGDCLAVDLAGLEFVDVVGLGVIVDAAERMGARGGRLVLRSPSRLVRRVLALLELADRLPVEA